MDTPDPHQPAHEAVSRYIASLGTELPEDEMARNIMIWQGVYTALGTLRDPSVRDLAEVVRNTPSGVSHISDGHPAPDENGHAFSYQCAMCVGDSDAIAMAVLRFLRGNK